MELSIIPGQLQSGMSSALASVQTALNNILLGLSIGADVSVPEGSRDKAEGQSLSSTRCASFCQVLIEDEEPSSHRMKNRHAQTFHKKLFTLQHFSNSRILTASSFTKVSGLTSDA